MQLDVAAPGKQLAKTGILVQLVVMIIMLVFIALTFSEHLIAVAIGSLSYVIPHSIFSYWVFRYAGATKNQLVAQSFSQGMKIKLILTSLLFFVAYSFFHTNPLFLLGSYATIMVSQWLTMYWCR